MAEIELHAGILADTILRYLDVMATDSNEGTKSQQQQSSFKQVEENLSNFTKLVTQGGSISNFSTSEKTESCSRIMAESISEMEGFLELIVKLMGKMIAEIYMSDLTSVDVPLSALKNCLICFATWTDKSRIFSERLVCFSSFGNLFLKQFVAELKIYTALWIPSDSFIGVSKMILTVLMNIAQVPKCHSKLIENNIVETLVSFCFHYSAPVRWEVKSIIAMLLPKIESSYCSLIKLSSEEMKFFRLCFENAAISDNHSVIIKLEESFVTYSALELILALLGLVINEANRKALADEKTFAAVYNMLNTGSMELKHLSIQLMTKLVDCSNDLCFIVLQNHPEILEVLNSITERDGASDSQKQDASRLLQLLLEGVSGALREVKKKIFQHSKATPVNVKEDTHQLFLWAKREMAESRVLFNAIDNERHQLGVSLVYLTSRICEMQYLDGSVAIMNGTLKNHSDFLPLLQDFMQKHFIRSVEKPSGFQLLHPFLLGLHCTYVLSSCNHQFRCELGSSGMLWQLVGNLRTMQVIPGWTEQHFRIAALALLIIANCSLEVSCQDLLADNYMVKLLLPFCKSDYFAIRIAAKSLLSSVCCSVPEHHRRLLKLTDVEHIAIFAALKEFSADGSYKKMFCTSHCHYHFSAMDLLLLLSALAGCPLNVAVLLSRNIYEVVVPFLSNGSSRENEVVLEILWKLCHGKNFALKLFNKLHGQIPIEVFSGNHILCFGDSVVEPKKSSGECEDGIEDLLFETMNEVWNSRVPAPLGTDFPYYLLNPSTIMDKFIHLGIYFKENDDTHKRQACLEIIKIPTFLYLLANVIQKQIEAKATKSDAEYDVRCALLVFHSLQVWISCCEELKDHLGHCRIISNVVLLHLTAIQILTSWDKEFFQIAEGVLSTLCQCMSSKACRNYLLFIKAEDLLVSFAKSTIPLISSNTKMILSSLSQNLRPEYQSSFKLKSNELHDFLNSLEMVTKSGVPEGEMYYSALEILQSFTFLIRYEPNREAVAYSGIYKPLALLLQNGSIAEKKSACELFWKLVTKPVSEETVRIVPKKKKLASDTVARLDPHQFMSEHKIQLFLQQNYPEVLKILHSLSQERGSTSLFSAVNMIVKEESEFLIGTDFIKTVEFAEECYNVSKYVECFQLCSWLYQTCESENLRRKALELKGKALYFLFIAERSYQQGKNISKMSLHSCYNMAREAINLLGLTVDSGGDKDAERLLDEVHFIYIRETRSPDLIRCLLCHRKRKLMASHVWPKAVLEHYLKCIHAPQRQAFSVPWKEYGSLQSAKQMTFPMLCGDCEQMLNRSCEIKFKQKFFNTLYDPENYSKTSESQSIEYDEYLYRFCISIIFRALPLADFDLSKIGNGDDIYNLFATCRKLLLSKKICNEENKPSVALLISPTAVPKDAPSVPMIQRVLHSAGLIKLSLISLHESTLYHGKASFLLAGIGVLNLVVSVDSQFPLLLPPTSMISAEGGIFIIPEDLKRFHTMPLGLWREIEQMATGYAKRVFHLPQKLLETQDWAKMEVKELQSVLKNSIPEQHEIHIDYLPDNIIVKKALEYGGVLNLPLGHKVLLHTREENKSWEASIFLVIHTNSPTHSLKISCDELYAVLMLRKEARIVCIAYFVSNSKPATTACLVSSETKSLLPTIEETYETRKIADALLPKLLQMKGFSSMEALLFWLQKGQYKPFDMKCVETCWYCCGRCNNCMEMTSFERAPLSGYQVGGAVRFCDNECMKHYRFRSSNSNTQLLFHDVAPSLEKTSYRCIFKLSCGLLDQQLLRNKVVMHLYAVPDSSSAPQEKVCVLVQARLDPTQKFFAFFLSNDLVPVPMVLSSVASPGDRLITAGLQSVMHLVLKKFCFANLYIFVDAALKDKGSFSSPQRVTEITSSFFCIDYLPFGFKLSEEDTIIPQTYNVVFHDTMHNEQYITILLVSEDDTLLALFYKSSVDCSIKVAYNVERCPLAVRIKQELLGYDRLVVDSCRDIVYAVLADAMLKKRMVEIGTISYKCDKEIVQCPTTCWFCSKGSTQ